MSTALASGWTTRAERLLDELDDDSVEHGYVALLHMYRHLGAGNLPAATEAAARGHGRGKAAPGSGSARPRPELQGRLAIYAGRIADGLALLDEAMAGAAAGEVTPVVFGDVYCAAIEGCQEIGDFGRVAEWTSALHRWCLAQPGLVAFTGQCSVHRGQLMRVHGAWPEALEELASAIERYRLADSVAAMGLAECERGDVLRQRGEYDAAETAYQRSSEHGYDPQPGLALLWLAAARTTPRWPPYDGWWRRPPTRSPSAGCCQRPSTSWWPPAPSTRPAPSPPGWTRWPRRSAPRRCRPTRPSRRARWNSPPETPPARCPTCARLASSGPTRRAPTKGARVRLVTGRALTAVGDVESARKELEAACATFRELGATPAAEEAEHLLRPADHPAGLTDREVEVLRLVASGRSNTQIAAELVLSEKTVARHLSNIFVKLDVGSRTAAAAYAFEHRLV